MDVHNPALDMVEDGFVVGLGTGRAATAFVHALARRVKEGLRISGVPTSKATAELAIELGIPVTSLDEAAEVDVAIDGADEVDPQLNLIKGYGGALVREKIVAASAKQFIVLVGPEKLVSKLGARGKLPIEVLPFGAIPCRRWLESLGLPSTLRGDSNGPYVSDNGNYILDCAVGALELSAELESKLREIPGLVGTGLFLKMADIVIIQDGDIFEIRRRDRSSQR
jgi:ribose 5-phosphate isomerase A